MRLLFVTDGRNVSNLPQCRKRSEQYLELYHRDPYSTCFDKPAKIIMMLLSLSLWISIPVYSCCCRIHTFSRCFVHTGKNLMKVGRLQISWVNTVKDKLSWKLERPNLANYLFVLELVETEMRLAQDCFYGFLSFPFIHHHPSIYDHACWRSPQVWWLNPLMFCW